MGAVRKGETTATRKWESVTYWPLTVAAVAFLITYTVHVVGEVHGVARVITTTIISATWIVFVVDYLMCLLLARPRWAWFRSNLLALAMVVFPPMRAVLLLDAFTRLASFRRTAGSAMRARLLIYGVGAALLLVWYIALIVLEVERHAPGATIVSFGDSVWWAFCTLTTVGYGDYSPVTIVGRVYAVILMAGGVVLVGLIVASISSWALEWVSRGHDARTDAAPRISGRADPQHGA